MPSVLEFTCHPLHAMELSDLGKERLSNALMRLLRASAPDDANAFVVSEDESVFMRFDGLRIRNHDSEPHLMVVEFMWERRVMCHLPLEGARLSNDVTLYLRDIEGRQRVML